MYTKIIDTEKLLALMGSTGFLEKYDTDIPYCKGWQYVGILTRGGYFGKDGFHPICILNPDRYNDENAFIIKPLYPSGRYANECKDIQEWLDAHREEILKLAKFRESLYNNDPSEVILAKLNKWYTYEETLKMKGEKHEK